jgi:hypothetical protein
VSNDADSTIFGLNSALIVICGVLSCERGADAPNLIAMKAIEVVGSARELKLGFALFLLALCSPTLARDGAQAKSLAASAPLEIPHVARLALDARAAKRRRANIEQPQFLDLTPGLAPLPFPRNSDVRARILTPELRRTPVVGWIAANLYRDKKDTGWCLEVDPGEGEYVVFYRVNLRR